MSKRLITLYTDYKSPYAYLAKDPAYELEDDFDVLVDWRHFTLDIPSFLGAVETRTAQEWRKVRYTYMDMRRWANKRGLTVKGPRKVYDSSPAGIGMLFAQRHGAFRPYNDRIFERFWTHQLEVDDISAIKGVLAEVGVEIAGFDDFLAGEGRQAHDEMCREAEAKGVFGVPTFILDDELFWGYDRMELLRERLRGE
ncbi:MAG: DsbA family protein [Alphaproteobacteria bacterium]|jgi:2-hydroxychromene-2-carboxylate isomerase|nr:DsbA family protein [Alphaproteobacteria bacterium]MDP6565093.1 DsbA family protein [Alphaproteobacteria bacterium]MDP6814457.1 DsbA family protein [Alphaproteobacteria bacterium]|tara:strand:+ start:134 stop:724 length:591 start_codon:yes stop_codon:yes gene_type:complete